MMDELKEFNSEVIVDTVLVLFVMIYTMLITGFSHPWPGNALVNY